MPIYARHCDTCNHDDESLESIHADDIIVCPICKKVTYKKIISKTAVSFAGSGWYKDGYSST